MRFIVFFFLLLNFHALHAQQPAFSLYPINPLLVNPAFTGAHGRTEIAINHRQQWLGIDNAPAVSTFQFDHAMTPQISLGLQARRIERGAVNTNVGNILFAYNVLMSKNASLHFGLAGGLQSTGLNSNSTFNPSDPAVVNLLTNEMSPDLKFGVNYRMYGLNLGISLTEMIANRPYASNLSDNSDFKFYENYILNVDYKFELNSFPLIIQPFALYHQDKYQGAFYEGGVLMHYNQLIYLGGLYRQEYGMSALAGLNIQDFRLAYAYELAPTMIDQLGQGSHEVLLSYRFGKKAKKKKKEKPQIVNQPEPEETILEPEETVVERLETEPEKAEEEKAKDTAPNTQHTVYFSGNHPNELPMGYYVIAGAFDNAEYARANAQKLSKDGVFAGFGYNSERKMHFVYVYRSDQMEKTRDARDDFRKKARLKDAWLLEIR